MSRNKNNSESNISIKESEMIFRTIADQSLMGIAIIQDDVFKYVNQKLADLLEYSKEEMMNWGPKEYYKLSGPESIELVKVQSPIKQMGLPGAINYEILQFKKKSGKLFYVDNFSNTVMYQGRTAQYSTIIDISRRVEAEQKIKYQAELVENVSDAIVSTDMDFNILSWNKAASSIYGWKVNETIGKNIMEIIPMEYSDDDEESVLKIFFEKGYWKGEVIQHRKDGSMLQILTSVSIIKDDASNPIGAVAVNRDITERKRSELELQESQKKFIVLFNSSTSGIAYHEIVYDSEGNPINYIITDVNPKCEKILSIKRKDVINKKATEIYKVDNAPYLNIYSKVAKTKESTTFEVFFQPMNKYFRISVLSPKNGEFITIFEDISEHTKAEQKLKDSEEKYREAYEQANLYKDLLIHDVNNIIAIIQGATQLYSLPKSNPEKKDDLIEIISNSANKANRLIANIRTLFQIEEGVDVSLESVDVLNYLNDAIKFTSDCFKGREVHITIDTHANNIITHANGLLINAFENLLNNGVKYNNNSTIEINIKISKEQKDNRNFIKIEFIDNGIGISDEFKKTIFQRGHLNTKGGKGLGFGLSVVKKLIKIYNGEIWAENRIKDDYSKGTKFIVLLPGKK